jgi:hypothetical protein
MVITVFDDVDTHETEAPVLTISYHELGQDIPSRSVAYTIDNGQLVGMLGPITEEENPSIPIPLDQHHANMIKYFIISPLAR